MTSGILVLGGFGTIGARLAEHIARSDNSALTLSSRSPRKSPPWAPSAQTCVIDIARDTDWSSALAGFDTIVHLVSLTDFEAKDDPDEAWRVGVEGTRRLLDHALRQGVRRIVFMSTGHVYGTPYTGHITEHSPPNPQQPYATTHLAAEDLLAEAHASGRISAIRLRLSNGFGFPKIRENAIWQIVINDLCRQAIEHGSLTLKSAGLQERNFIPFTDVCSALAHVIELDEGLVGDGLFNLGSNASIRIVDVAERVRTRARVVLGVDLRLTVAPDTDVHTYPELRYDSTKLRSTGLVLSDDIDSEIDALLRYCAENFGTRT